RFARREARSPWPARLRARRCLRRFEGTANSKKEKEPANHTNNANGEELANSSAYPSDERPTWPKCLSIASFASPSSAFLGLSRKRRSSRRQSAATTARFDV